MSVDLKGNTNYVALRGLPTMENGEQIPGPYVVPRTNLSAIDMNVANGITAVDDTLGITLADPLEVISNMHGIGILNADTLATALSFSRGSVVDISDLQHITFIGSVPTVTTTNGVTTVYGIPIPVSGTNTLQINYEGPLPAVSEKSGLWLIAADVMTTAVDAVTIGMQMGQTTEIAGYSGSSNVPNVWTRVAFLLDTNASVYNGALSFYATFENAETETSFSFKNVSVVSVSDLTPLYQSELAGVIGTEDAYMFKPGTGIAIRDNTISMAAEPATVKQLIAGTPDALVGNEELTGAITAGKAVDVTNMPSVTTGDLDTGVSALQAMTWTGTTGGDIGFYDELTAFPAYADGLVYLLIADITNNGTASVTVSGTDALNASMPVVILPGKSARVAMTFDTATSGFLSVSSIEPINLLFTKFRELEVTGCSQKAREYIAKLADPDETDEYYLIDQDSVNPWMYMIDMKKSTYTLVQPGLAYKLFANDGNIHTLAVPAIKANTYGRAAYVELFVGSGSNIKCQPPLRMANGHSLTDNTLNNCSVTFMDGIATLTVDSTESSYIVTTVEGTTSGTLAYGISGSTASLVIFNSSVDTLTSTLSSVSPNGNKEVRGNGLDKTYITGSVTSGEGAVSFGNVTFRTFSNTCSVNFIDDICIEDSYTNDSTLVFADNITLVLNGMMYGDGTTTFGNHDTIDASQNTAGGVLMDCYTGTISVPTGSSVTFKGVNGYTTTITGNKTGKYLLADGAVVNAVYSVASTAASGNNTLNYGITTDTNNHIVFSHSIDGNNCPAGTVTINRNLTILGNSQEQTSISGSYAINSGKFLQLYNISISGTISSTGTVVFNSVTINGDLSVTNTTLAFTSMVINANSTLTYTYGAEGTATDGHFVPRANAILSGAGTLDLNKRQLCMPVRKWTIDGITITNTYIKGFGSILFYGLNSVVRNCEITGCTCMNIAGTSPNWLISCGQRTHENLYIENCYIHDNVAAIYLYRGNNSVTPIKDTTAVYIRNSIISEPTGTYGVYAYYGGRIVLDGSTVSTPNASIYCNGGIVVVKNTKLYGHLVPSGDFSVYVFTGDNLLNYNNSTSTAFNVIFVDGTRLTMQSNSASSYISTTTKFPVYSFSICTDETGSTLGGSATFVARDGTIMTVSGCKFSTLKVDGTIACTQDIVLGAMAEWTAINAKFASPLNAHDVDIVKLSGTTFTEAAKISAEPKCIQLPANTTVNIAGNTNPTDTKILKAPIIIVGDTPTSGPNGSATIVGGTITPRVIEGIGTYIDKEGDNDFTTAPVTSVTVADGSASVGGTLASAFAATTEADGTNRWIKLKNNIEATVEAPTDAALPVVDKNIITDDYESVLNGTYTLASGGTMSVNEATKETVISGASVLLDDVVIPNRATMITSGGVAFTPTANITGGGILDFAQTEGRFIKANSAVTINGCTVQNGNGGSAGGFIVSGTSAKLDMNYATVTNNTGRNAGGLLVQVGTAELNLSSCTISGNTTTAMGVVYPDIRAHYGWPWVNLNGGCTIGNINCEDGQVKFTGYNKVNSVYTNSAQHRGSATITNTAILDFTGNTNPYPINFHNGAIIFYPGAATIFPEAGEVSAYRLGGMTIPNHLGNTNVVDMNGSYATVGSNTTASASRCSFTNGSGYNGGLIAIANQATAVFSNCVFSGGTAATLGGAVSFSPKDTVSFVSCTFVGNSANYGGTMKNLNATSDTRPVVTFSACTISGNVATGHGGGLETGTYCTINLTSTVVSGNTSPEAPDIMLASSGIMNVKGNCTIGSMLLANTGAVVNFSGKANKVTNLTSRNATQFGDVVISKGASVQVVSSINPGGQITLYGGSYPTPGTTTIVGSGGNVSRAFDDVEIHATSIDSKGIIYGATIYAPTGVMLDHYVHYTPDGGTTDSSVIIHNADCPYVVPGGLLNCQGT